MKKLLLFCLSLCLLVSCSQIDRLRKAAEKGDANAQFELGYCYYNGTGVAQDYEQAVGLFRKAAEQGNVDAQLNLGFCYLAGLGVTNDDTQAIYWYRKAAEQGLSMAHLSLAFYYEAANDSNTALFWLEKAVENRDGKLPDSERWKEKVNELKAEGFSSSLAKID